jgi:hypothetical protein
MLFFQSCGDIFGGRGPNLKEHNMKSSKSWAAVLMATVISCAASAARADVMATFNNDSPTDIVQITSSVLPAGESGGSFYAGRSNFTVTGGTDLFNPLPGANNNITGFCIDLQHNISNGEMGIWKYGDIGDALGAVTPPTVLNPSLTIAQITNAVTYLWLNDGAAATTTSSGSVAAAFQIALWQIIFGSNATYVGPDVAGAATLSSAAIANDNTVLPDVVKVLYAGKDATSGAAIQNFSLAIVGTGTPFIVTMPVPSAAYLGATLVGALGLIGAARRKRPAML